MKTNLKNEVKKDLTKDIELSFDTSKLESNQKVSKRVIRRNVRLGVLITVSAVLTSIIVLPIAVVLATALEDTYKDVTKNYTLHEPKKQSSSTFKPINQIIYPDNRSSDTLFVTEFNDEEKDAYYDFSNKVYEAMNLDKINNGMISPITLYGFFMASYGMIEDATVKQKYNDLLTLDETSRVNFYRALFSNNFKAYSDGLVELHNGAFIDNLYTINQDYIDYLTSIYNEAFSLKTTNSSDIDKMLAWVNQAVGSNNFFKKSDLDLNDYTSAFLFSTLNFNMKWGKEFSKINSHIDKFYLADKSTISVKYMKHTIPYPTAYDYGNYVSLVDNYMHRYSVTYIIPKNRSDSIYKLIENKNIFKNDPDKKTNLEFVDLHVPVFEYSRMFDFKDLINNLDLGEIFSRYIPVFNKLYTDLPSDTNIFLGQIKQKNMVKFSEEGTVIKSVNMAELVPTASAGPIQGKDVKLNQPFIYIIKDQNGMPLYVGHMDNPNLKGY